MLRTTMKPIQLKNMKRTNCWTPKGKVWFQKNDDRQGALNFAREHDWGQEAELEGNKVTNLKNRYSTKDGEFHEDTVSRAANMKALRRFGGY